MRRLGQGLLLLSLLAGVPLSTPSGAAAAQVPPVGTSTPVFASPTSLPGFSTATLPASPTVRVGLPTVTITPVGGRIGATQTAAIATIAAADATATAAAGRLPTSVAATATALAQPTSTLSTTTPGTTRTATPALTSSPSPTQTSTPALATASATPDPLATSREVYLTAPATLGGEQLAAGATVLIPRGVALQNGTIPPGTTIRTPNGTVFTIPPETRVPAVDTSTTVTAPLNSILQQEAAISGTSYPAGTTVVVPSGTLILGQPDPQATVLLQPGSVVQVAGQMLTLTEPLAVVVSTTPLAQPAALPRTGDAEPVLWPIGLGLVLVLLGWRLRRAA